MKLKDIADYVTEKISSDAIDLDSYITTDSLLQNKAGRDKAVNMPPQTCMLTRYKVGDILVANIRPYLKKVWMADIDGGCNADVLVFRAKSNHSANFLYAVLLQDAFYTYAMKGAKGSKMPRGDRDQIMRYEIPMLSASEESIGNFIVDINAKIALNREINRNLEVMARQLYDYWFVQFDFPDENGRPYKSSGGAMKFDKALGIEIPAEWKIDRLNTFITSNNTGDWGYDEDNEHRMPVGCIRGADIVKLNDVPLRYIKKTNTHKLLSPYDIVIEVSGGSPVQATGRCAYITPGVIKRNYGNMTCSNFCHAFRMKTIESSAYFYFTWKTLYDNNIMFNFEGKTSGIKNFMTETFLANKWYVAPDILQKLFFNRISNIFSIIDSNIEEINHLIKQRDELLPLLMNGQVSVMPSEVNCDLSHD